jgi:hypothetical protein
MGRKRRDLSCRIRKNRASLNPFITLKRQRPFGSFKPVTLSHFLHPSNTRTSLYTNRHSPWSPLNLPHSPTHRTRPHRSPAPHRPPTLGYFPIHQTHTNSWSFPAAG